LIYPYICIACGHEFEVTKRIAEIDNPENCASCKSADTKRTIARTFHFYGADDWNKAEYSPAFGQIVKSNRHKKELMRKYGVEEIGNEDPNKLHASSEKQIEEKGARRWNEV